MHCTPEHSLTPTPTLPIAPPLTPPRTPPPLHALYTSPGQVVALIEASGLVLGVSTNLLGLTLVAWGNSAGMGMGTCRA